MKDTPEARCYMLFRLLLAREVKLPSLHCAGARVCPRARAARLCLRVSFITDQCVYVCSSVRGQSSPVCRKLGAFTSTFRWLRSKVGADGETLLSEPLHTHPWTSAKPFKKCGETGKFAGSLREKERRWHLKRPVEFGWVHFYLLRLGFMERFRWTGAFKVPSNS